MNGAGSFPVSPKVDTLKFEIHFRTHLIFKESFQYTQRAVGKGNQSDSCNN